MRLFIIFFLCFGVVHSDFLASFSELIKTGTKAIENYVNKFLTDVARLERDVKNWIVEKRLEFNHNFRVNACQRSSESVYGVVEKEIIEEFFDSIMFVLMNCEGWLHWDDGLVSTTPSP